MCSNSNTLTLIHMPAWREASIKGLILQPLRVVDFGGCKAWLMESGMYSNQRGDPASWDIHRGWGVPPRARLVHTCSGLCSASFTGVHMRPCLQSLLLGAFHSLHWGSSVRNNKLGSSRHSPKGFFCSSFPASFPLIAHTQCTESFQGVSTTCGNKHEQGDLLQPCCFPTSHDILHPPYSAFLSAQSNEGGIYTTQGCSHLTAPR